MRWVGGRDDGDCDPWVAGSHWRATGHDGWFLFEACGVWMRALHAIQSFQKKLVMAGGAAAQPGHPGIVGEVLAAAWPAVWFEALGGRK